MTFFGLNYYTRSIEMLNLSSPTLAQQYHNPHSNYTQVNWEIYPEGLYRMIKKIDKIFPGLPVIITENGLADTRDDYINMFFDRYLYSVSRAISEGCNVKGYIAWSFMDNFEWDSGFGPRFGLYHTNYTTQERTLKQGTSAFINAISDWKQMHNKTH